MPGARIDRGVNAQREAIRDDVDKERESASAASPGASGTRRLQFLAEAGRALAASNDYAKTLAAVARIAVPIMGDYCAIYLREGDASLRRVAVAHHIPAKEAMARRLPDRYRLDPDSSFGPVQAVLTRTTRFFPTLTPDMHDAVAPGTAHGEHARAMEAHASIVVPLETRGRVHGAISFVLTEPGRQYEPADRDLAEELARHAAVAVENARLHAALRRAADEQARSLSLLDAVFAATPVVVAFLDRGLRFIRVNQALSAMTRLPPKEHAGRPLREVVPDLAAACEPLLRHTLETGEVATEVELSVPVGDPGSVRHWLANYFPVLDADGAIIGVGLALLDITARKRAELTTRFLAEAGDALVSSLDFRTTLPQVAQLAVSYLADWCVIDVIDDEGMVERIVVAYSVPRRSPWSPPPQTRFHPDQLPLVRSALHSGAARFYPGVTLGQVLGVGPRTSQLAPPLDAAIVAPLIARGRTLGTISAASEVRGRCLAPGDLEVVRELARRAALALDNARLYRESQTAVRVREDFLSTAAHELKTPLTTIKGYGQLLLRALADPSIDRQRLTAMAQRLVAQTGRFELLVSDLLDVSRIQQGRLALRRTRCDLTRICAEVLARFDEAADRAPTHRLRLDSAGPLLGVWDPHRLDQVMANLVSNALKFSPRGGDVQVTVSREGDQAVVRVADQGIGIPVEEQGQLFQPFARGSQSRWRAGGTGLGLYICRQIVEQHGGTIAVESQPGVGSVFTLRLPLEPTGQGEDRVES